MVGVMERLGVSGEKKLKIIGLTLMGLTGLLTTLANSLVQYVGKRLSVKDQLKLSTYEVLFIRSVIQLVFCVIYMIGLRVHWYGSRLSSLCPLLLMGVVEVGAIVCIYLALERMPVGDESVIRVTTPVFTAFFSLIVLRRGCKIFEVVCGLISFVGVIIIAKPNWFGKLHSVELNTVEVLRPRLNGTLENVVVFDSSKYYIGAILAVSAAIMLALFFVLNKLSGKHYDIVLTVFYPSLIGVIVSPFGMLITQAKVLIKELDGENWVYLCTVGVLCFVGLMFMAEAFQLEDPGPVALVRNLDVVFAFILQYFLMNVPIAWTSVVGALLVLIATSIIVLSRCVHKPSLANERINSAPSEDKEPLVGLLSGSPESD